MKRPLRVGLIAGVVLFATAAVSAVTLINFETGYLADQLLPTSDVELLDADGDASGVRLRGADGSSLSILGTGGPGGLSPADDPGGSGRFLLTAMRPFEAGFGLPQPYLTLDFTGLPRARRVTGDIWGSGSARGWSILATFGDGSTARADSQLFPTLWGTSVGGGLPGTPVSFAAGGDGRTVSKIEISVIPDDDAQKTPPAVQIDNLIVAPVPLPLGAFLLLSGVAAMAVLRRRRAAT